jgi:hypothetical protein
LLVVLAWSRPLTAFVALKISKNGLEVRKLWPFEIEGGRGGDGGEDHFYRKFFIE